jgi:hypothetical protein
MKDYKPDTRKLVHMHPYHYSLIHHSLGVPTTSMQPPLYHLDVDNEDGKAAGALAGGGGVLGTKFNQGTRDGQGH